MSTYLLLIYDEMARRAAADEVFTAEMHARHGRFADTHAAAIRGGAPLADADTATSIRQDETAG